MNPTQKENFRQRLKSFKWLMDEVHVVDALRTGLEFMRELIIEKEFKHANEFNEKFLTILLVNFGVALKDKMRSEERIKTLVRSLITEKEILGTILDTYVRTEYFLGSDFANFHSQIDHNNAEIYRLDQDDIESRHCKETIDDCLTKIFGNGDNLFTELINEMNIAAPGVFDSGVFGESGGGMVVNRSLQMKKIEETIFPYMAEKVFLICKNVLKGEAQRDVVLKLLERFCGMDSQVVFRFPVIAGYVRPIVQDMVVNNPHLMHVLTNES
jgi:hypothetical protein